jgi:AmmeMemoRadiSam system protein B
MLSSRSNKVRPAAVAGTFYPDEPETLQSTVRRLLADAAGSTGRPKALIAPHAGYIYSGPIAASAYAQLAPLADRICRVVLLGPAHRVTLRGLALPGVAAFETPLGEVEIDEAAVAELRALPQVVQSPAAHALEHSLEVQLPFLQTVLREFRLVPLAVGDASTDEVAEVIERLWGGDETLIVISSDLSHYLSYADACRIDRSTVDTVLALEPNLDHLQACGATPINGLLRVARAHGLVPRLNDLRNSGDTAGDRSRVVGYASISFVGAPEVLRPREEHGQALLAHARRAIESALGVEAATELPEAGFLDRAGATFVTLRRNGTLRGCMERWTRNARCARTLRSMHAAPPSAIRDSSPCSQRNSTRSSSKSRCCRRRRRSTARARTTSSNGWSRNVTASCSSTAAGAQRSCLRSGSSFPIRATSCVS